MPKIWWIGQSNRGLVFKKKLKIVDKFYVNSSTDVKFIFIFLVLSLSGKVSFFHICILNV